MSLELRRQPDGFVPASPAVPISIGLAPQEGVTLPDGAGIRPAGVGRGAASAITGNSVFWANVRTDTDLLAQPTPTGAELAWTLRSEHSPTEQSLSLALAPGERVRRSKGLPGAVEILRGSRQLDLIQPPSAYDAAAQRLKAYYTLSGNRLTTNVVTTNTTEFPVLVDPEIVVGYGGGGGNWSWWQHFEYPVGCGCYRFGSWQPPGQFGLFVGPTSNIPGSASEGMWYMNPGNGVSISRVDMQGMYNSENPYQQDWFGAGIYENGTLNANGHGDWTENGYAGSQGWTPYWSNGVWGGHAMAICAQGAGGTDSGGQPLCNWYFGGEGFEFISEVGANAAGWAAGQGSAAVTAAQIRYTTPYKPHVSITGLRNSVWFNSHYAPTVHVRGESSGFGVTSVGLDYWRQNEQTPPAGSRPLPGWSYSAPCNLPLCDRWLELTGGIGALETGEWYLGPWTVGPTDGEEPRLLRSSITRQA